MGRHRKCESNQAPRLRAILILISFVRTTLNLDQFFFRPLADEDLFFYRSWDPIRLKIIAVVNEGPKVLDICTTLTGLPDLASDGSPLFAVPMFLFR